MTKNVQQGKPRARARGGMVGDVGEVDVMQKARARDVPALAWLIGWSSASRPYGTVVGAVLAVIAWPVWVVGCWLILPNTWHVRHRVVATITPPGRAHPASSTAVRAAVLFVVAGPVVYVLVAGGVVRPAVFAWFVGVFFLGSVALWLSMLTPYPGRIFWAGPKVEHPGPFVVIGSAGAIPGSNDGALIAIASHVRTLYGEHICIEVIARDRKTARAYGHWNLRQLHPNRGRMVKP